jgi:hypothetical protein
MQDELARSRDRHTRLVDDLRLQNDLQVKAYNKEVLEQKTLLKEAGKIFEKKKTKDQEKINELERWIESMAVENSKNEEKSIKTETTSNEISENKIVEKNVGKVDMQSMTDKITVFDKFTATIPKPETQNQSTNTKFCATTEIGSQTFEKIKLNNVVLDKIEITGACFENVNYNFC